jgi:hypothetical protein
MVIPDQVAVWIDRCQRNIEKMQENGIDAATFRQQYMILSTIMKVADSDAYFTGTQYVFPNQRK